MPIVIGLVTEETLKIWNEATYLRSFQNCEHLLEKDFSAICINSR